MTIPELQSQILSNTRILFMLAEAVGKLPESETRGELIYKHDKVLLRLANLGADLVEMGECICYYGFTDRCPGVACAICQEYMRGVSND